MSRAHTQVPTERGFTIVELLIAVVVIGVLAGIAIPLYLNQKAKANDALVIAQIQTINEAIQTALADDQGAVSGTSTDAAVTVGTATQAVVTSRDVEWSVDGTANGQDAGYCIAAWSTARSRFIDTSPLRFDSKAGKTLPAGVLCEEGDPPLPVGPPGGGGSGGNPVAPTPPLVNLLVDAATQTITWAGSDRGSTYASSSYWCVDGRDLDGAWTRLQCVTGTAYTDPTGHPQRDYRVYPAMTDSDAVASAASTYCPAITPSVGAGGVLSIAFIPSGASGTFALARADGADITASASFTTLTTATRASGDATAVTYSDATVARGQNYTYAISGPGVGDGCRATIRIPAASEWWVTATASGRTVTVQWVRPAALSSTVTATCPGVSPAGQPTVSAGPGTMTSPRPIGTALYGVLYECSMSAAPTAGGAAVVSAPVRVRTASLVPSVLTGSVSGTSLNLNWTQPPAAYTSTVKCLPNASAPSGATTYSAGPMTAWTRTFSAQAGITYDCSVVITYNGGAAGADTTTSNVLTLTTDPLVAPTATASVNEQQITVTWTRPPGSDFATGQCVPIAGSPSGATTLSHGAINPATTRTYSGQHGVTYDCTTTMTYTTAPAGSNTRVSNTVRVTTSALVAPVLSGTVSESVFTLTWTRPVDAASATNVCTPISGSPSGATTLTGSASSATSRTVSALHGVTYDCVSTMSYNNSPSGANTMVSNTLRISATPLVAPTQSASVSGTTITLTWDRPFDAASATARCVPVSGPGASTLTGSASSGTSRTLYSAVSGTTYDCTSTMSYSNAPSGANTMTSNVSRVTVP